MISSLLISIVLVPIFMGRKSKELDRFTKLKHGFAVLILILDPFNSLKTLGWLARNPDKIKGTFFSEFGVISPTVNFAFELLHSVAIVPILVISFLVAQGNDAARRWLIRFLPMIFCIQAFYFFRGFNGNESAWNSRSVIGLSVSVLVVGAPYFMIFRFYTNPKNLSLFSQNREENEPV